MSNSFVARVAWVLWPSFLVAIPASGAFFSLFDPHELTWFGQPVEAGRMTLYTIGFVCFWLFGALSSGLTVFLAQSPFEVNRCPLEAHDRPDGCPKRDDTPAAPSALHRT